MSKSIFDHLNAFMSEVGHEKTAAANTEAGGYTGGTSHPVKDVEDGTKPATTGARASENASDNKSHMDGRGEASVDSAPEAKAGGNDQDKRQLSGKATGEDPSVEDDYKSDKDDPGTTHPMKTEDGEKYASVDFSTARSNAIELGNSILADIATGKLTKSAAVLNPAQPTPAPAAPAGHRTEKQAAELDDAARLGYELAAVLGVEKMSAEQRTQATVAQTIRDAEFDADLVGGYLSKLAEEGGTPDPTGEGETSEDHSSPGDADSGQGEGTPGDGGPSGEQGGSKPSSPDPLAGLGGGGAPPADPGAGAGGADLQQVMQLLQMILAQQGGGAPPAGGDPLAGGGAPPMGGDPLAGGGAPTPPGAGGGGVGEEEALSQLAGGMGELGVSEQELAGAGPVGEKMASAVRKFKRSGKYQIKEASNARERQIRNFMKSHILELVGA